MKTNAFLFEAAKMKNSYYLLNIINLYKVGQQLYEGEQIE